MNYGITYRADASLEPIGYVDSDFAGCKNMRQSTEGNIFLVAGRPVSWETKRQDTVALSTVEAEFMAFSHAMTQALWLSKYFKEIGLPGSKPIVIHADNSSSIAISTNDKNHRCMKHIDVHYHFIKERAQSNNIVFQYVPTSQNLADFLMKPLPRDTLRQTIMSLDLDHKTLSTAAQGEC